MFAAPPPPLERGREREGGRETDGSQTRKYVFVSENEIH